MTAEIGVLNRYGVALAADSAVTIGNGSKIKVLNTANKLFNLSQYEPVGIMVYGNGDYLHMPWEVIVKEYRKKLERKKFDTVKEYCNDFFKYLFDNEQINSKDSQKKFVESLFVERLNIILDRVNGKLFEIFKGGSPEEGTVIDVLKQQIKIYEDLMSKEKRLDGHDILKEDEFISNYSIYIHTIIKDNINVHIYDESIKSLYKIAYYSVINDSFINYSGVVFAGYGEKEYYPCIYEYIVCGRVGNFFRIKLNIENKISNESNNTASIVPFAQQEMVHAIIRGIEPTLEKKVFSLIDSLTNGLSDILEQIIKVKHIDIDIAKYKDEIGEAGKELYGESYNIINGNISNNYIKPILNMVAMLPKDELAKMAETLVNLTSFKRRITIDQETVGGPIDVAVISKSDGFIWIKRKYYFNSELNHDYFNKNKGECEYVSK